MSYVAIVAVITFVVGFATGCFLIIFQLNHHYLHYDNHHHCHYEMCFNFKIFLIFSEQIISKEYPPPLSSPSSSSSSSSSTPQLIGLPQDPAPSPGSLSRSSSRSQVLFIFCNRTFNESHEKFPTIIMIIIMIVSMLQADRQQHQSQSWSTGRQTSSLDLDSNL